MDNGVLSFIPPDGEFKLLDYQVAAPKGTARPIGLPLNLKAKMAIEVGGGEQQAIAKTSTYTEVDLFDYHQRREIQSDAIVQHPLETIGKHRDHHPARGSRDLGICHSIRRQPRYAPGWRW